MRSRLGPTPPETGVPIFSRAQGDDASGKVNGTAWFTPSAPALPTTFALYGRTASPASAAGAAATAPVGTAAAPAATPLVNFKNSRRETRLPIELPLSWLCTDRRLEGR